MQQPDFLEQILDTLDVYAIPERFIMAVQINNHLGEPIDITYQEFALLKEMSPGAVVGARVMVNTRLMRDSVKEVTDELFKTYRK